MDYSADYGRLLTVMEEKATFAEQKDKNMKTMMKTFERFSQLIQNGVTRANPYLTFETVCRMLKVSPEALDELLLDELGMCGEQIIAASRKH